MIRTQSIVSVSDAAKKAVSKVAAAKEHHTVVPNDQTDHKYQKFVKSQHSEVDACNFPNFFVFVFMMWAK